MTKTFTLQLNDLSQVLHVDNVESFVGRDASGSFGLQAGHETFVTCLRPGLARFRDSAGKWHYIAQPGAVVLFAANRLQLSATRMLLSDDRDALVAQMDAQWQALDRQLGSTRLNITQVEQALARKLWDMSRRGETL